MKRFFSIFMLLLMVPFAVFADGTATAEIQVFLCADDGTELQCHTVTVVQGINEIVVPEALPDHYELISPNNQQVTLNPDGSLSENSLRFFYTQKTLSESGGSALQQGIAAYDASDYETAFQLLFPLAQQGDAEAAWRVGVMYDNGYGVKEDDAAAYLYTSLSAEQGNADGQWRLGVMYKNEWEFDDALKYFKLSAEQGNTSGLFFLADMYEYGHGVEKDIHKAIEYYKTAADKGDPSSAWRLGYLYECSEDLDHDYQTALHYYEMALSLTDETSTYYSLYLEDIEEVKQKIALSTATPIPSPPPTPTPKVSGIRPYMQDLKSYSKGAFTLTGPDLNRTILGDRWDWPNNGGEIIDGYVKALVDSGNFTVVDTFDEEREFGGENPFSSLGKTHTRHYEVALDYKGTENVGRRISMWHGNKSGHIIIRYGFRNSDVEQRLTIQYAEGIDLIDLGYRYGSSKPVASPASTPIPRPTPTSGPTPIPPMTNPQFTATMSVGERKTFTFIGVAADYEKTLNTMETFQWEITIGSNLARVTNATQRTCTVEALQSGEIQLVCIYKYTTDVGDVLTGKHDYKTDIKSEGYAITIK